MTDYYFIRVNGDTDHNKPSLPACRMRGEPANNYGDHFNYVRYCLENEIIRVGWPNTGDLRHDPPRPPLRGCRYKFQTLQAYRRRYLTAFREIMPGSVVLMPDPDQRPTGMFYMGVVKRGGYSYEYDPPDHPFECAHRQPVKWDRPLDEPYHAGDFRIEIRTGFWRRGFALLNEVRDGAIIRELEAARRGRLKRANGANSRSQRKHS